MTHIFISYSKKDTRALATALHDALLRLPGVTAWMDTILEPDASWARQIEENIDRADYVIVLLSSDVNRLVTPTQRRSFVLNEIDYAQNANKPILPVMVERTKTPVTLAGTQYIDLTAAPNDPAAIVSRVRQRFGIAPAQQDAPPPAQPPPAQPPAQPPQSQPLASLADWVEQVYAALDTADFQRAADLLRAIEQRGAPPGFPLKALRAEAEEGLAAQQAAEARRRVESEAAGPYAALRRLVGRGRDERIYPALVEFWQHYPGYDPDDLARFSPERLPLTRASQFTGTRNADWAPHIATFANLRIPDMRFCLVPRGSFQMGEGKEQHAQTVAAPFWIAQFPVTNAQWAVAVKAGVVQAPTYKNGYGDTGAWFTDRGMADAPVAGISWFQARDFAAWLGARLPTELEWEFAARGLESWVYPWGNAWNPEYAVHEDNSGRKPNSVASRPGGASWVGAAHLSGNVWEWMASRFAAYPYPQDGSREKETSNSSDVRYVLRGGSWFDTSDYLRAAYRYDNTPSDDYDIVGFRCALSY